MIIGIMGAMPDEVDQLCAKLEQVTKETYAGVEYHQGMLNGRQVVVCCAGMGKANAASTVQVLITKYGAEKIIFSGIAGNMTSKIGIGDVCVGETVVYHDAQNDMIAQSAPFTAEYHGDPALVKAALDACNACGVKADSVILMTLFVALLLSGTARLNSLDPKPASQSELQKEPAE